MKRKDFILLAGTVLLLSVVFWLIDRNSTKTNYEAALDEISLGMPIGRVEEILQNYSVEHSRSSGISDTWQAWTSIDANIPFGIMNGYTSSLLFDTSGTLVNKETMDIGF